MSFEDRLAERLADDAQRQSLDGLKSLPELQSAATKRTRRKRAGAGVLASVMVLGIGFFGADSLRTSEQSHSTTQVATAADRYGSAATGDTTPDGSIADDGDETARNAGAAAQADITEATAPGAADQRAVAELVEDNYSPIAEALESDTAAVSDEDRFLDAERQAQAAISECMRGEGFDYEVPDDSQLLTSSAEFVGITEFEYVETYGFGFTTTAAGDRVGPAQLDDPNAAIVYAMPANERNAYFDALHGPDPFAGLEFDSQTGQPIDPESGKPANLDDLLSDYEPAGCMDEAYRGVAVPFGPSESPLDAELERAITNLYQSLDNDPRVVAADAQWTECMGAAGYDFGSIESIFDELKQRLDPLAVGIGPPRTRFPEISEEAFSAMTQREQNAYLAGMSPSPVLTEAQRAELDELHRYEIEVATASFACQEPIEAVYTEVRIEMEEQFVRDNQAAFDAANAAAGN